MSEWGVPNWRDQDSYGPAEQWGQNRWRWEFLRRRTDLREEFDRKAPETYAATLKRYQRMPEAFPDGVRRPDEPGFWVSTKLIGVRPERLPNPRIGEQPFDVIFWNRQDRSLATFLSEEPPEGFDRIDFDLTLPIGPQLEMAKVRLMEEQEHYLGKVVPQPRRHRGKWITYLRVLDARADGASWSQIGCEVLNFSTGTPHNARDVHRQAESLCFNFLP